MRNLIKRLRMDRNGKLVTRWIKPSGESKPVPHFPAVTIPSAPPQTQVQNDVLSQDRRDVASILKPVLERGLFGIPSSSGSVLASVNAALDSLEPKTAEVFAKSLRDHQDDSKYLVESIQHILSIGKGEIANQPEREIRSIFSYRGCLSDEEHTFLAHDAIGYTTEYEEFYGMELSDFEGEQRQYVYHLILAKYAFHTAIVNDVEPDKSRKYYDGTIYPLSKEMRDFIKSRPEDIERIIGIIEQRGSMATPGLIAAGLATASVALQEGVL